MAETVAVVETYSAKRFNRMKALPSLKYRHSDKKGVTND